MLVAIAVLATPAVGLAQSIPKDKGPARVLGQFNFFCLKHLPDLDGIERAAGFGEYDQLLGDDLAPFIPDLPHDKLLGWRYHDHGDEFILTAMRAKPDDDFKKRMPGFAAATLSNCTLRVPNAKPELLVGELTRAIGRAADKSWLDGSTHVHSWTHTTPDAVSYVQLHVPENKGAKAVLDASVYLKK